jgi:hypothetical protein
MVTGFVMAAIASLCIVTLFSGALAALNNPMAIIALVIILAIVAALLAAIGTGVAWAAYRPGGPNSIGIWISMIWNMLLLGCVVYLRIMTAFN